MQIMLDQDQEQEIKKYLFNLVKESFEGMHLEPESRPYLNRNQIAAFFGVSPNTIDIWVRAGAPVAVIEGRKFYGKESLTNWLKQHEEPKESTKKTVSGQTEKSTLTVL
ncbi:DNA-binding protein [Lactobacillus delbrueckii]|nr:DNA-binding protein [Lactobacillus delbrueckii subsp. bulgaricus]PTE05978.1 DNA-binding protein [Lactobacillus delbrueckii]QDH96944.1 DNA-binding protein [Lactobacillus delbrueckii subsp. bulgaricus]RCK09318.1 DNA-binding protein [Lactobacillus delbrueckii subsp. bulgaricus]UPT00564.1 DNA-binding protein [Lactobacillus delbrueckii subsp. bulgaricus]